MAAVAPLHEKLVQASKASALHSRRKLPANPKNGASFGQTRFGWDILQGLCALKNAKNHMNRLPVSLILKSTGFSLTASCGVYWVCGGLQARQDQRAFQQQVAWFHGTFLRAHCVTHPETDCFPFSSIVSGLAKLDS